MKEIGGYFELEISRGSYEYHPDAARLKSGRAALHHVLNEVKPTMVYLPFYTCDALLEPFSVSDIPYTFYALNHSLEPLILPNLKEGEFFLYIDYFGLKAACVKRLVDFYAERLIIDATQSFFSTQNFNCWMFNSCRKFFGVPDGSYLYTPAEHAHHLPDKLACNENYMVEHLIARFNGDVQKGYPYYKRNELLNNSEILKMSKLTEFFLSNIDYEQAKLCRRRNFEFLHNLFKEKNEFFFDFHFKDEVPFCYPFLPVNFINKSLLWTEKIFVPEFWIDCQERNVASFDFERHFSRMLLPLPIDHRYSLDTITYMAERVLDYCNP